MDKDSSDHWSEWSANGSSDQWSGALLWVKDPKLITVRRGFGLDYICTSYMRYTSVNFPAFGRQHLCYVNSNLFLWKSSENRQSASEIQIFEWVVQNFVSVLPRNCRITPPSTRAWNPLICNIAWDIITGYFCSFVLATSCYFAVRLGRFNAFAPIVMVTDPTNQKSVCYVLIWVILDHKSLSGSSQRNATFVTERTQSNAMHVQLLEKLRPIALAETCRFLTIQSLEFKEIWQKIDQRSREWFITKNRNFWHRKFVIIQETINGEVRKSPMSNFIRTVLTGGI